MKLKNKIMKNITIEKIIDDFLKLKINEQIDYNKFYLYSIITHSTAIEGSTVTEIENQLLFDEGLANSKPLKHQLMNMDLKKAYDKSLEYCKQSTPFSIDMLCNLSSLIMYNTGSEYNTIYGNFSSAKGELRQVNVSAGRGGKSYMAWQKVPTKLQDFCDWINNEKSKFINKSKEEKYKISFEAHYRLATIHPFADGNGRLSRLVMNMIQEQANIIPSVIKKEKKIEYIKTLAECQENEDSSKFIDFMLNHHKENLLQQIEEYKKSIEKDIEINTKRKQRNDDYRSRS